MAGRAGGPTEKPTMYQMAVDTMQDLKGKTVTLGERVVRSIAQAIWGPGSRNIDSSDSSKKARGIRQQASIQDYADYSKLTKGVVLETLGKVGNERELLHFCLLYNPSRLEKAGIITHEQCAHLKGMFDRVCEKNPDLLETMVAAIKDGKSLSTLKVEDLFTSRVGSGQNGDKSAVNDNIHNVCGDIAMKREPRMTLDELYS